MAEDKEREKYKHKAQGRCISHMEMMHLMLGYVEVVTNLDFCKVSTMPLELRAGIKIESDLVSNEDGAYVTTEVDYFRRNALQLDAWRYHTDSQLLILDDLKLSKITIDKVTQFSLRPPELMNLFDMLGNYYRWFQISKNKIKVADLPGKLSPTVDELCWIDGLQRQIRLRRKAVCEVRECCLKRTVEDAIDLQNVEDPKSIMVSLMLRICTTIESDNDENATQFRQHVMENLVHVDEKEHLPIPVFSYIIPTMGVSFVLHIMLSMGRFATKVDLTLHGSVRECLRYCKLVGPLDDENSLKRDTELLMRRFIEEQIQYFPNSQRVIDFWMITAMELFERTIVKDELPVSEMPPVQLSKLLASMEEDIVHHRSKMKSQLIDAAIEEVGDGMALCNVPSKQQFEISSSQNQLQWDAVECLNKNPNQSEESFLEQKLAIKTCVDAIDSYRDLSSQGVYIKNVGIRGFPGSGKSWSMMYCMLYAISKGLNVVSTAMMCKRALQLGGIHVHQLFMLPVEEALTPHRKAELAILKLLRNPKKIDFVRTLDVIFFDEMGQVSSEYLSTLDIILRKVRGSNVFFGGILIIFTMDHTQLQPVEGRPFLTSCHILSCFKMVTLVCSVRASNDPAFKRIQQIARYNYQKILADPQLVDEFLQLCSDNLTFVTNWDDDAIPTSTMRLYSKKVPAKEAARQFVDRVKRQVQESDRREREAEDVEKSRYSHQDWSRASEITSSKLEQRLKEPRKLLLFRGAVYDITFNKDGEFSQSQLAILFDLPSEEDLENWRKIKILVAPLGLKEIEFREEDRKEVYLNKGFVERFIGVAPERMCIISNNVQAQRKQYGLKHRVTSTIHAAMGDTLPIMATEISRNVSNFKMWDKGQMIVILSRTKLAKNTIFVGDKNDTLSALKDLLTTKTQWTDYMEEVLKLITINSMENESPRVFTQSSFPYRVCDVVLPQCNTGYVYMLLSLRDNSFTYIGKTMNIRKRIQQHNAGVGSSSTEPIHLRPYALAAYISGFDSRNDLLCYIETKWKQKRDRLIRNGNHDVKAWSLCGSEIISEINEEDFGITPTDLTLVCLFDDINNDD